MCLLDLKKKKKSQGSNIQTDSAVQTQEWFPVSKWKKLDQCMPIKVSSTFSDPAHDNLCGQKATTTTGIAPSLLCCFFNTFL